MRVPEGWTSTTIDEITTIYSGGTPSMQNETFWGGVHPWITAKDLKKHYLDNSIVTLSDDGFEKAKKAPKGASLILVRGMTLLKDFPVGYASRPMAFNQDLKALLPGKEIDGLFLSFFLVSQKDNIRQFVSTASHGTGKLDTEIIKDLEVHLPTLPEQQKIAQILSTWDKAIEKLEALIAAKQKRKKALMQQLLTGKKRFAGFGYAPRITRSGYAKSKLGELPNDWKVERIKKYFWYQEGPGVRQHQFTENGVKLFNGTNIQFNKIDLSNTTTYISIDEANGTYKHFLAEAGDLVIACSGISVDRFDEKTGFIHESHLPLCMNTSTMRFKVLDKEKVNIDYFKYFMQSSLFKNQIRRQITGSAQLNFGPSHVGVCYVVLPDIEEQKQIASALSVADTEIATHQKQLSVLKQQKKALMQQLLTGKKRVRV